MAPPECYIAGAEGQLWPCRWAWLLAFLCESLVRCETPASDFGLLWMRKRGGAFRPQLLLIPSRRQLEVAGDFRFKPPRRWLQARSS